ncbi:MAG: ArsR/SmtB family transcription factor [Acidimicrobiales bacterium]
MPTATSAQRKGPGDPLDHIFQALSDPTRRSIITTLTRGEATMSEIAAGFEMSLPGVSKHVSVLEEAGLVRRWRSGRSRRCRLEPDALRTANLWLEEHTEFWTNTLDALATHVEKGDVGK